MKDGATFFELADTLDRLASSERDAFIDAIDDGKLREALREYASTETASDNDPQAVWSRMRSITDVFSPDSPPINGRYQVVRQIGRGGMGLVFLAEDRGVSDRPVALKVLSPGTRTLGGDERAAMVKINHPNVAQLLDFGQTENPRFDFLVLAYIEGVRITTYCTENDLGLDERLRLFDGVCRGVWAAHDLQIMHRDISHNNVLVESEGTPKVIDFGLAKELPEAITLADLTATANLPGTEGYASPERIERNRAGFSADIYALGVLLSVLVTGRQPIAAKNAQMLIVETVRGEPRPPSAILATEPIAGERQLTSPPPGSVESLRRRCKGALDAIVMKALARDPADRYPTPLLLARDVDAFLKHKPVTAHRGSASERLVRLVRRNRALSVTIGAASLFAVLALAALINLYAETRSQRDEARAQGVRAETISGFLTDLFQLPDPWNPDPERLTARGLLDQAAGRLPTDLSDEPLMQADLFETLGGTYANLALYDEAEDMYERALELRSASNADPLDLARVQTDLGHSLVERGRFDEGEALLLQALEVREARLPADAPELAQSYHELGHLAYLIGEYADAVEFQSRALAIRRTSPKTEEIQLAESLNDLAATLVRMNRYDEAQPLHLESLEIRTRLFGEEHPYVLTSMGNLSVLYERTGKFDEAEGLQRRALEIEREKLGPEHPNFIISLNNYAFLLESMGRFAEAEPFAREAALSAKEYYGASHPGAVGVSCNYARLLRRLGRYDEATRRLDAAAELLDPEHWYVGNILRLQAEVLLDQGRHKEALPLVEEALETLRLHVPEDASRIAATEGLLGEIYRQQGALSRAEPILVRAYEEGGERERAESASRLVRLYEEWGRTEDAARYRDLASSKRN